MKKFELFIFIYTYKKRTSLNKLLKNKIYYYAKRLKSIEYLGKVCSRCGQDNPSMLCFHHLDSNIKDYDICRNFGNKWDNIKLELDKCILLCNNCHMELHYGDKDRNEKKILLEFKNEMSCSECGYDKCIAALEFHHVDPKDKEFGLASVMHLKYDNALDLKEKIEDELNKCIVLCRNCHKLLHSGKDFIDEYKDIILEKVKYIRHKQDKLDRNEVFNLYQGGMKQIDIARHFNTTKSTISVILKKYK